MTTLSAASLAAEVAKVRQRTKELEAARAPLLGDDPDWLDVLRAARVARRLTQAQVAMRMGVTQPVFSAFEAGKRNLSIFMLARYAAAVGYQMNLTFEPIEDPGVAA